MISFTHIINPVKVTPTSDLFEAQPITFQTMLNAKKFARDKVLVNLVTTQYAEDHSIIPDYFIKTKDLERSVLDLETFEQKRKLPLLIDILEKAMEFESDYIIYTNSDIALLPHFYLFVNEKIDEGKDAFVINRRTISKAHNINSLNSAYSELGIDHPGFDCFIFKKELLNDLILERICIGAKYVGLSLYLNLSIKADCFKEFDKEHVTFHVGNDRIWKDIKFNQFEKFNEIEFKKIKLQLETEDSNIEEIIDYALRYWKNEQELPKWKVLLINLFSLREGTS